MSEREACWGVIPAAGVGSRMGGDTPKQYMPLANATVLEHSLAALLDCTAIAAVMIAVHPDDHHPAHLACFEDPRVHSTVGGVQRSDSVLAALHALQALARDDDWVLVHDAARPCVCRNDIEQLIRSARQRNMGAILAEPVVDTVKRAAPDGLVSATLDRSLLWRAQTPQMFRLGELRQALELARERDWPVTDEASAMELAGYPVQLVAGSSRNLKVTTPADLSLANWYLQHPGSDSAVAG